MRGLQRATAPDSLRGITASARRYTRFTPLILLALLILLPVFGLNLFWQGQIVLMAAYALVVSGVSLTFGYAGEMALGQVAMMAAGAYVAGWLGSNGANDVIVIILAAAALGAVVGLISGLPGLRVGGWALAMASFFLVVLLPDLTQIIPGIGGSVGLSVAVPQLFGHALSSSWFMVVALAVLALWLLIFRNFVLSRHGAALKVLRESPDLTSALGVSVYRMKLIAYVGGSIPAAIGGCLLAWQVEFVGPLLLLVAFQTQRTQNDFQRFAVLGKILELRVHSVRLL